MVTVVIGHIFKDPQEVVDMSEPPIEIPTECEELIKQLEG